MRHCSTPPSPSCYSQPVWPTRRTRRSEWCCPPESRWGTGTVTRTTTTLRLRSTGGFLWPRYTTLTLSSRSRLRGKETSELWKWSMVKHWGKYPTFSSLTILSFVVHSGFTGTSAVTTPCQTQLILLEYLSIWECCLWSITVSSGKTGSAGTVSSRSELTIKRFDKLNISN